MLKEYKSDKIRNVVILGHLGTGKSTLFDAMLLNGNKIDKIGDPESGLTSDFGEDEKSKKMSIRSSMGFVEIDDIKINIIDTPGTSDFIGEARSALQVARVAILVVDSVAGVQIETEKAWRYLKEHNIPTIIFVNKMDKERANYEKVISDIRNGLKASAVSLSIPHGEGKNFEGVVDIIEMKLMVSTDGGKKVTVSDIPDSMKELVEMEKTTLLELAAEGDDELIEKYLETEELTDEEIKFGLQEQLASAKIHPVICGSSAKGIGIKNLINVLKTYVPAPEMGKEYSGVENKKSGVEKNIISSPDGSVVAVVWKTYIDQYAGRINYFKVIRGQFKPDIELYNSSKKDKERISKLYSMIGNKQEDIPVVNAGDMGIVLKLNKTATGDTLCDAKDEVVLDLINLPHPVFTYAIETVNKADTDKMGQLLKKMMDENPTLVYSFNDETKETVLSGMGDLHLGMVLQSLKDQNKIEVKTKEPRIAYRETITKKADAQYKHKKQSGGSGQYGEVYFNMTPLKRGEGFRFTDSIVGGAVPKQYIPGVEKGVMDALDEGVLAKFPVVDVEVNLYDGTFHAVDSSEMAFKIAGRNCFKKGMEAATPLLLEPVMNVQVFVDKDYMGDILSDVTSKRGRVLGMESAEDSGSNISVVNATIPLSELLRYSIDLKAMTSGKATFEMQFSHYDPITGRDADIAIANRLKQLEDEK